MEGPLSPIAWLMIAFFSSAGAWVYLAIRPYDGHWSRLVGMFVASTVIGMAIAPAFCEFYSLNSIYQHIFTAFGFSLLGMPLCKAAVSVTESEAVVWIKKLVARIIGIKDEPKEDGDDKS